ncbi:protein required for actin cytoskeleton organization and cell cycle progression [Rickenella mellea]|uniref:Protein SDA1 n=1 Tax=Rickenella mellea TaxID=50990 RepID=A0A4R5XDA9_9AGAM|nr:protein required for actin cytoskeleton organization and cell cycle progression [Rickenella mellea]
MVRSQISRGILLASNLPQLQNLIKRDPAAYKDEFLQQWSHYESIRKIFDISPDEHAQHFREIVTFVAQVAHCYPKETAAFPSQISSLLLQRFSSLNPETRKSLVSTLVMLRNKDCMSSIDLLRSLFPLLPLTSSSSLRASIRKTILSDIRTANLKSKNHILNRAVQAMLLGMVERGMSSDADKGVAFVATTDKRTGHANDEALWAVALVQELWKKGVWNDAKTVSIMATGCFHPVVKVQHISIKFFLAIEDEEDSEDEEESPIDVKALHHRREVTKKTRSGDKKLSRTLKAAKKHGKTRQATTRPPSFSSVDLLNDPQTFGEKLYDSLKKYDSRFTLDHKILVLQLLSRIMSAHKLCILSFYTYIVRYVTYHQLRIPAILSALAQSVHDLTPPDVLTPVVRKIAQEFIHPGVGGEVITAGLNAIREVCKRQPWCIEEDLLGDLVEYRKSREKSVVSAARSLLHFYREVNPSMLKRRERGKESSMRSDETHLRPYGQPVDPADNIDGLPLLEEHLRDLESMPNRDEADNGDDWDEWEVDSAESGSSSEDGWIDVDSDGVEDVMMSDSEDEGSSHKKQDASTTSASTVQPVESTLATSKVWLQFIVVMCILTPIFQILTPADFALLHDLRIKAARKAVESGAGPSTKRKLALLEATKSSTPVEANAENLFVSEQDILGPRKKLKASYSERVASIQTGREGRERFGSNKGKKKKDVPSSSTNREKLRNKPIMMIMASSGVRGKKKASLRDKQKKLRAHVDKAKKTHH